MTASDKDHDVAHAVDRLTWFVTHNVPVPSDRLAELIRGVVKAAATAEREKFLLVLHNIAERECHCDDEVDGVEWADDATDEDMACAACLARMEADAIRERGS